MLLSADVQRSGPAPNGAANALDAGAILARIAQLEAQLGTARAEAARHRMLMASAVDHAIIMIDLQGAVIAWNRGAQAMTGYGESDVLAHSANVLFTAEDRANGRLHVEMGQAIERGLAVNERWHVRRDGSQFWASGTMVPLVGGAGQPEGFLNIFSDRTAVQTEAERRELLVEEMNHRIKNTYALVQALATQTARHVTTVPEFLAAFGQRLQALARATDELIRAGSEDLPLQRIVEGTLAPHRGEKGRIRIEGPPVTVRADLVAMTGLVLHELGTNAAKYGALSSPDGWVEVVWAVTPKREGKRTVRIAWREHGGPAVSQPRQYGFGSRLLERGLPRDVNAKLDYKPGGLECLITLPVGPEADP